MGKRTGRQDEEQRERGGCDVELESRVNQVRLGSGHGSPRNIASEKSHLTPCLARVSTAEVDAWEGFTTPCGTGARSGCLHSAWPDDGRDCCRRLGRWPSRRPPRTDGPVYFPASMKKAPRPLNPRRIGINGSQHGQPVGQHRGTGLTPGRQRV